MCYILLILLVFLYLFDFIGFFLETKGPGDDMIFPLTSKPFMDGFIADRLTDRVHGRASSRQQRVPLGQRLSLGQ